MWRRKMLVGVGIAAVVALVSGALVLVRRSERPAIPDAVDLSVPLAVVELPDPPVGQWDRYNIVPLVDGRGFLVAGGGNSVDGYERPRPHNLEAALFRFSTGAYELLPELPVKAGLGAGSGAVVGGPDEETVVVVGQDCPPGPEVSAVGIEFCSWGGSGAKVVLSWNTGEGSWTRHELPKKLEDFSPASPSVIGVDGGLVWLASETTGRVPRIASFDPSTGSFSEVIDGPAEQAGICLIGSDLLAFVTPATTFVSDMKVSSWAFDGAAWQELPSWGDVPTQFTPSEALCTPQGYYSVVPTSESFWSDLRWTESAEAAKHATFTEVGRFVNGLAGWRIGIRQFGSDVLVGLSLQMPDLGSMMTTIPGDPPVDPPEMKTLPGNVTAGWNLVTPTGPVPVPGLSPDEWYAAVTIGDHVLIEVTDASDDYDLLALRTPV